MNGELLEELKNITAVNVLDYEIPKTEFYDYYKKYKYAELYSRNSLEKALEHFVSIKLLEFVKTDVFIDIASCGSTFPNIIEEVYGCTTYRQDLTYPFGINGKAIGGDACILPFNDKSISKLSLHCSFEHFERDSDTRFIKEVTRVLRPGGKLCILPLYLKHDYYILTDPSVKRAGIVFDDGAGIKEQVGWKNHFGRHYNPAKLVERVLAFVGSLTPTIYLVSNAKEVDESCYLRYILILENNSEL